MDRVRALKNETPATGGGQDDGPDVSPTNPNQDYHDARGYLAQNDTSNDVAVGWTRDASNNITFFDGVVSGTKTLASILGAAPGTPLGAPTTGDWSTGQASLANTTRIVDAIQVINASLKTTTTTANTASSNASAALTAAGTPGQKALGNPTSGTTYPGSATITTSTLIADAVQALNAAIAAASSTAAAQQTLGSPTSGDYSNGQASLATTTKIVDAIQAINNSLKTTNTTATSAASAASAAQSAAGSPGQQAIGNPTAGNYSGGQASVSNSTLIADAIQAINYALKTATGTANAASTNAGQQSQGAPTTGDWSTGQASLANSTKIVDAIQAVNVALKTVANASATSAGQQTLGAPTSGDWSTGQATLANSTKIADAVQAVNVALKATNTTAASASSAASAAQTSANTAQTTANSPGQQNLGNPTTGDYTGYASFGATSKIADAMQALNSALQSVGTTAGSALTAANNFATTNTPNKLVKRAADGSIAVSTPVQIFATSGATHTTTTDESGTVFQLQGGITSYSFALTLAAVPAGQNIMFVAQHVAIAGATLTVKSGAGNIYFNGAATNGTLTTTFPQSTIVLLGLAGSSNYIAISLTGIWSDSYTGKVLAGGFSTDLTTFGGTATASANPNSLMVRDASGGVAATTFTGALNGNANTATSATSASSAASATNFTGSLGGEVTGAQGSTSVGSVGTASRSAIQSAVALVAGTGKAANTFVASDGSSNAQRLIVLADLPAITPAKIDPTGSTAGQNIVSTGPSSAPAWGTPSGMPLPALVSVTSTATVNPALADNNSVYYCNVSSAPGAAIQLPAADLTVTYVYTFMVCNTNGVTVTATSGTAFQAYGAGFTAGGTVKCIVVGCWFTLIRFKGNPSWFLGQYFTTQNNALSFS